MRTFTIILAFLLWATPSLGDVRPTSEIAALIASASPGDVVTPPAGVFTGPLRINKSITLDGAGAVVIDGGGTGTVIEVTAPNVTLRRLTVRGTGQNVSEESAAIRALGATVIVEHNLIEDAFFGIDLKEAPDSIVRHNIIHGKDLEPGRRGDAVRLWWSHGSTVSDNQVFRTRDMVFWYSEGLTVARNRVSGSRYGLHFMYSHDTLLADNELAGNSVGVYLMYSNTIRLTGNRMSNNRGASGYGIGLKDCDDIVVDGNALLSNRVGVYVDNSPSSIGSTGLITNNLIAFNETGLLATPNTHDNVLSRNVFAENEDQVSVHGRGELTANSFSSDGVGNFWSDYAGFDRDGDGVGDLAYEPRSLFSSLLATEPNLRLFLHSPAQQAIEFTGRALPELRPSPIFSDPAPMVRQPTISAPLGAPESAAGSMAALGAGLIAFAGIACGMFTRVGHLPSARPTQGVAS